MKTIIRKRSVNQKSKENAFAKEMFLMRVDEILPILRRNAATIISDVYNKSYKEKQVIHNVISGRTQNENVLRELEEFAKDYTKFLAELRAKAQETKRNEILQTV